jgi:lipooligosaccharide transport system permease protein
MEYVLRQFDYWATLYRRTWKGTLVTSFLMPFLYLAAMGIGLGSFVDENAGPQALGGATYLQFIGPGLLAATAMQTGIFEATYPVMSGIKWQRFFYSMIATPLRPADVVYGNLVFIAFRTVTTCAVFAGVIALFGGMSSWLGVLTVPVALLVGMAYAAPVFAISARLKSEAGFSLVFRFGLIPMFLFSGAFFPVSQLPDLVEWLAYLTPLWHGVELSRGLGLGDIGLPAVLGHTAYLLVWFLVGLRLAVTGLTKRLVK